MKVIVDKKEYLVNEGDNGFVLAKLVNVIY